MERNLVPDTGQDLPDPHPGRLSSPSYLGLLVAARGASLKGTVWPLSLPWLLCGWERAARAGAVEMPPHGGLTALPRMPASSSSSPPAPHVVPRPLEEGALPALRLEEA